MAWVTEDGTHEGYVGAELEGGRLAATYSAGVVEAWNARTQTFDAFPNNAVIGWVVACGCGWRGHRWDRVTDPDSADWATGRVYDTEGEGWAPPSVEDAGHEEWKQHADTIGWSDELELAAREADAARRRLNDAVAAARADGASWADIGRATGLTRQSAHERWSRTE